MNIQNKLRTAALCSIVAAGAVGCGSLSTGNGNTASAPATTKAARSEQSGDARADLVNAMRASLDAKSYRARMVASSSSGSNRNITSEIILPDRMHITTEMESAGRPPVRSEVIYIGKDSYMKNGDSAWQKGGLDMSDMFAMFRDTKTIDAIAAKSDVKYIGEESLDGAAMMVYEYTIKDLLGPGKDGLSRIWIGADDNLQHQVISESDFDPLGTGKTAHSKTTVTFYDYNADIRIEPPV